MKLLPCPVCGGEVEWHNDIYGNNPGTFIVCPNCRNQFGGGWVDWNRRVYPASVTRVLEAAKKVAACIWDAEPNEKWIGVRSTCIEDLLAAVRAWKEENENHQENH